jgi:hypothetical protein
MATVLDPLLLTITREYLDNVHSVMVRRSGSNLLIQHFNTGTVTEGIHNPAWKEGKKQEGREGNLIFLPPLCFFSFSFS